VTKNRMPPAAAAELATPANNPTLKNHTQNEYQRSSLIDPLDKIVLQTELDNLSDKLGVDELGVIINLADCLSCSECPTFSR